MSYQAITDVIVNPLQIQNLQLSTTVKDSPIQSSSKAFSDYLSYYQNGENSENSSVSKSVSSVSQNSASSESVTSDQKTQASSKTEENQNDEKVSQNDEVSESKESDKKSDEKVVKNDENQNLAVTDKGENQEKEKKITKNDDNLSKNEKKLSSKDFAKINELTEDKTSEADAGDVSKFALNLQNITDKTDKTDLTEQNGSGNEDGGQDLLLSENSVDLSANIVKTTENESQSGEFNFSEKNPKEKNELTLDKDGKIKVEDLRTQSDSEIATEKKSNLKISDVKVTGENSATMTMELNQNINADVLSLNNQTASSSTSNFQQMLNNQIRNSAPEFVKAGNLVLKDNNQGTINLVLHPDDLGNVKIHLSLDGKSISGHITVATKEALEVFKDNAETLREAFIKNGFDSANFDVAFNNGGSFNQNMGFENQDDGRNLLGKYVYDNKASALDAELENIIQNTQDISNYSVNIVA